MVGCGGRLEFPLNMWLEEGAPGCGGGVLACGDSERFLLLPAMVGGGCVGRGRRRGRGKNIVDDCTVLLEWPLDVAGGFWLASPGLGNPPPFRASLRDMFFLEVAGGCHPGASRVWVFFSSFSRLRRALSSTRPSHISWKYAFKKHWSSAISETLGLAEKVDFGLGSSSC